MISDEVLLITSLAFILLGILVGIIFLSDAWSTPRESIDGTTIPLSRSPKMRGLIYAVGGGIIPSFKDILSNFNDSVSKTPVGSALVIYTLSFAFTVLIGLLLSGIYAFVVSYTYLAEAKPNTPGRRLSALALPYVITALRRGDSAFKQQLQEIALLSKELITQRDNSVEFLTGVFIALVHNNMNRVNGTSAFIHFIEKYLQVFIQKFLDPSKEIDRYRACIYVTNRELTELLFLTGVSPPHARHSREPLSLERSLAGWARKHPGEAYIHIRGRQQNHDGLVLPFEEDGDKKNKFFRSIIACAIQPLGDTSPHSPSMVLCIDCSIVADSAFSRYDENSFIKKLVLFLSVIIATAQASMSVSDDDLREWLSH